MSELFDADWLALREPVDHRSRPAALLAPLTEWLRRHEPLQVLDLGSGRGSNLRYLAPRLPGRQHWWLLDHDAGLLAAAQPPAPQVEVTPLVRDLRQPDALPLDRVQLVTGSALLDLVSEDWLAALAAACAVNNNAALFALNVDGQISWEPGDPDDADLLAAFHAHHAGDKGFGPALGTRAGSRMKELFAEQGYTIACVPSPWQLRATDRPLRQALSDGWVAAASEQRPDLAGHFAGWRRRCNARGGTLRVGHLDVLALPPER